MSRAAEAVSTPESDVGMTREGEARTCRSQARQGAHDRGRLTEEPCEVETLMHGVRREARHHIPGATGTHSKDVCGLPADPRPKSQRDRSMLGERRDCQKALYDRSRSTRPTW